MNIRAHRHPTAIATAIAIAVVIPVAIALTLALLLTRRLQAPPRPAAAPAPALASAPQRPLVEPLDFDPPSAGVGARTPYETCLDQPSLDGTVIDCTQLLPKPAKDTRRRR